MQLFEQLQQFLDSTHAKRGRPLISILGPTASGKTALSLEIAAKFNGEIISADSRQIYRYMDIGTDKILPPAQKGIRHHLLDMVDPDEEFTLAHFKKFALQAIEEIESREKIPLLVGGTGLYFNAVTQNYQIPQVPPNPELRQKFTEFYEKNGAQALYNLLQEHDPQAAARIEHPNNVRYVIRALEINLGGGMKKEDLKEKPIFQTFSIGIRWPRELLYERINKRVDLQIERGLVDEVKKLLAQGYSEKLPSMSSLGYPQIIAYIKGECTLEEAVEKIKSDTRHYAKRQMTWFRRYPDIHWIDGEEL